MKITYHNVNILQSLLRKRSVLYYLFQKALEAIDWSRVGGESSAIRFYIQLTDANIWYKADLAFLVEQKDFPALSRGRQN